MPAWTKFRIARDRTRWPSLTGYVPVPPANREGLSSTLNIVYTAQQETTSTGTSGTVDVIQKTVLVAPRSMSFRDWNGLEAGGNGTDAEAYLITGHFLGPDGARHKYVPWLTVHTSRSGLRGIDEEVSGTGTTTASISRSEVGVSGAFETVMMLLAGDGEYSAFSTDTMYDASLYKPIQSTTGITYDQYSGNAEAWPIFDSPDSFFSTTAWQPKSCAVTITRSEYTATYTADPPAIHVALPSDFTIEGYFLLRGVPAAYTQNSGSAVLLSSFNSPGKRGYELRIGRESATGGSTSTITFLYSEDGTNVSYVQWTGSWWADGLARYIALARDGNTLRFYVDGTLENEASFGASIFYPPSTTIYIGRTGSASYTQSNNATFSFQEWRISNIARYKNTTITGWNTVPFPRS